MLRQIKELVRQHPAIENLARKLVSFSPLSLRLGKDFWDWYAFLEISEEWSPETLKEWQFARLRSLLRALTETSEFYRERLNGVDIERITNLDQYNVFVPILRRQDYISHYSHIVSKLEDKHPMIASTSGTTGAALQFRTSKKLEAIEFASICHQWKRVGYIPGKSKRAEFRGLTAGGKLYQPFPEYDMGRFSIFAMSKENLPTIASIIRENAFDFFHGYPSTLYLLARAILNHNYASFPQPIAILLASEMVYETQLETIKVAFPKSRIYAHYGCAERTILAGWCEKKEHYHALPQYGITEFVEETGELIGTNLHNEINGFVRYAMTDKVENFSHNICPECHASYAPILSNISGRLEDYLYTKEKGWIAPAIVTYPLKQLKHIQEMQFCQKTMDLIEINYIPSNHASQQQVAQEIKEVEKGLRNIMGTGVSIHFKRVQDIKRGKTGKFKWIESDLSPETVFDLPRI